jgi:RimJ/RimL family protein N-acetyltransferase
MQPAGIDTERLILRPHRVEDYDDMRAMWSVPEVARYIIGRPSSDEEVWGRLLRYAGGWALLGYGFWAIRDRATGGFVGDAGFHNLHRQLVPPFGDRPELGFALAPRFQGKGLGREVAQAVLAWGDRTWPGGETVCMIAPENAPSLRIALGLGYVETGRSTYNGAEFVLFARRSQAAT